MSQNSGGSFGSAEYEELLRIAEKCDELVRSYSFWKLSTRKDELEVLKTAREAGEYLFDLYSTSANDSERTWADELIRLLSGRALLAFISAMMPRLVEPGVNMTDEEIQSYLISLATSTDGKQDSVLDAVGDCIFAQREDMKPTFSKDAPAQIQGKEVLFFDYFSVFALRAIRVYFNDALESFNTHYQKYSVDKEASCAYAHNGIEVAGHTVKLLQRLFPTVRRVPKCTNMLFAMMAPLLNNCAAAYHNLAIIESERDSCREESRTEEYRLEEKKYSARLKTCHVFSESTVTNDDVLKLNEKMLAARTLDGALTHLNEFCARITLGGLYLRLFTEYNDAGELMHWFSSYKILRDTRDREILAEMNTVAGYLIHTLDTFPTMRIIYNSNFYECMALELAYERRDFTSAEKIVRNGYDRYLEISTLSIIHKYDKHAFFGYVRELKRLCLTRILKNTDDCSYNPRSLMNELYGKEFIAELRARALEALEAIDPTDSTDPRNRDERITPDWAKKG